MQEYHTLEVEPTGTQFTCVTGTKVQILTPEELRARPFTRANPGWDSVSADLVNNACDVANRADVAAVVMQEGLAYVCLIPSSMTLTRQRIEP